MKDSVGLRHIGKMKFNAEVNGHSITLDTAERFGGEDSGPRPKSLLLAAMAGCTAMDVVSILNKMKVVFFSFRIEIDGNITDEHPKHYDRIHISYFIAGKDIREDKVKKAINLSLGKYCGVAYTMNKCAEITWDLTVE